MTDREQLTNSIYDILIDNGCLTDEIKQRIYIAMDGYEIQSRVTEIVPVDQTDNANVIRQFAIAKAVSGRSPKTIQQYTWALEKFCKRMNKKLIEANANDIRLYSAKRMMQDGISSVTMTNERMYLSSFFDWAVNEELMTRNPVRQTEQLKAVRIPKKAFTELECEKIRSACVTYKEKALVELLFSTACRISEVSNIRTCDIDGKRIMVNGKGNKYAQVYLDSRAQLAIENYINSRTDDNAYLFPGRSGKGTVKGTLERAIKAIGDRAGVTHVHAHRFRRTAATQALKRGMPIEMVSKYLRHEKIQTTMLYLDISNDELMYQHQKYVG